MWWVRGTAAGREAGPVTRVPVSSVRNADEAPASTIQPSGPILDGLINAQMGDRRWLDGFVNEFVWIFLSIFAVAHKRRWTRWVLADGLVPTVRRETLSLDPRLANCWFQLGRGV